MQAKVIMVAMWLEDIQFRLRLRKLQKKEEKVAAHYQPRLEHAREKEDWDEEQAIASTMLFEMDMLHDEINRLQHNYVTSQAKRLLIPIPDFSTTSTDWKRSETDGRWALSDENLARIAREVRQERRERLELVFLWPSALIGFIGGIAGIVSAFLK